jgi:Flp pilus assembly protein TadG
MLVFGIIGFGTVFNTYLAVTHAAREGARLAAVDKYSEAIVIERAAPLTTGGGLTVSGPAVVADASGPYVQVTVSYPYTLQIPLFGTVPLTVQSTSRMRQEN